MQGCDATGSPDESLRSSIVHIVEQLAQLETRLDAVEQSLKSRLDEHSIVMEKRALRTGELASRVAQRVARLETVIEVMNRVEASEHVDHA